jgi:hypothetical protein
MNPHVQLRGPDEIDWRQLASEIRADLLALLRSDLDFMSAETARDQCYHACPALREGRTPVVPFSMIARILGENKGTVKWHYNKC